MVAYKLSFIIIIIIIIKTLTDQYQYCLLVQWGVVVVLGSWSRATIDLIHTV